ncbi:MAG: esterase-like activity of phytase family protein [Pseudomonadota bacterium]
MTGFRQLAKALAIAFIALAPVSAYSQQPIEIVWEAVSAFDPSQPEQTRFGSLTFLRGGVLKADHPEFGGFSGLGIAREGEALLAISDRGKWLRVRLPRSQGGAVPMMIRGMMEDVTDARGQVARRKRDKDAEGLAVTGDRAFVSFERLDKVIAYDLRGNNGPTGLRDLNYPFPVHELRQNEGLEALAAAPPSAGLGENTLLAISEGSINRAGDLFAFVMSGPKQGTFFVRARNDFNVTDADFLPDGRLLLLERRFSLGQGLGARIRVIDPADIRPGATVDGPVVFEADLGQAIDNMEGMSVWRSRDGETVISLISDDNLSFLQQTVYLEFRYDGDER